MVTFYHINCLYFIAENLLMLSKDNELKALQHRRLKIKIQFLQQPSARLECLRSDVLSSDFSRDCDESILQSPSKPDCMCTSACISSATTPRQLYVSASCIAQSEDCLKFLVVVACSTNDDFANIMFL